MDYLPHGTIPLPESASPFRFSRPQLVAKGIKRLLHYNPELQDDAESGGKVVKLDGMPLVFVPVVPTTVEEEYVYHRNPEVELSWIGARSHVAVDSDLVDILKAGYIDVEEMRSVLLHNVTTLAIGKALGQEDDVRDSITNLIMGQLDKSMFAGRAGFCRMAYTAQLAAEFYEDCDIELEPLEGFDAVREICSQWPGEAVIDRVFRTEPELFENAMMAEQEGLLSGANVAFRALCCAATCIDSTVFPGLTLAEYRAVLIKIRYPDASIVERWSSAITDGVRLTDPGCTDNRLPRPGEVIGIDLGKLNAAGIASCESLRELREHILIRCASDDLKENNAVFLGLEHSAAVPEHVVEAAEAEIGRVFTAIGDPAEAEADRERHLHPESIFAATDSELAALQEKKPRWAKIDLPKGGLCEEPYNGFMSFEGRGGKYSIVSEGGRYFLHSKRQGIFSWVFQIEVLAGPLGRLGVKREKYEPGQELTLAAVVNTLMSKTGKDAPVYQRHALFLAQSHGLLGDADSSSMFPKGGADDELHNLLGVFHRRFVKDVDCVMNKSSGRVYMIVRGKPMLIWSEGGGVLTLQEHSGPFRRSQHRRVQLDIGHRIIG